LGSGTWHGWIPLRSEKPSLSPLAGFLVTLTSAVVVSFLLLGPPGPEAQLPYPGIIRDVVLERQAAAASFGWADMPTQARTPGAVLLLLPLLLVPAYHLTALITVVACVALGLIVAGTLRLVPLSPLAGLVLSVGLPVTEAFMQGVFHGSTFPPIAAAIVWTWVFVSEGRVGAPSVLLACAGVARLWPFLLLVPLWRRGSRPLVTATISCALVLTVLGMVLPGVTAAGSLRSLFSGGAEWIGYEHNGSAASWLLDFGSLGIAAATAITLAVYAFGLVRSRNLNSDIMWTLPFAMLASPLTWLGYLLVLAPIGAIATRTTPAKLAVGTTFAIQLVGFRVLEDQLTITVSAILIAGAVWADELTNRHDGLWLPLRSRETSR
jgi:hypothetical protein